MSTSPFGEKILARIYRGEAALSRNRNFTAYQDPRVQRAARISRQLKSLARDLAEHGGDGTVTVTSIDEPAPIGDGDEDLTLPGDRAAIQVRIEALECRHTAFLSRFELELLREDPDLAALLDGAAA